MFGDSGDNDIGYIEYDHGANSLALGANATTGAKIDSSGNLDIPSGNLTVSDSGSIGNGQGEYMQTNNVSDSLAFHTGGTERLSIKDDGALHSTTTDTDGHQITGNYTSGNNTLISFNRWSRSNLRLY